MKTENIKGMLIITAVGSFIVTLICMLLGVLIIGMGWDMDSPLAKFHYKLWGGSIVLWGLCFTILAIISFTQFLIDCYKSETDEK